MTAHATVRRRTSKKTHATQQPEEPETTPVEAP